MSCHSANHDFEECSEHKIRYVTDPGCEKCVYLQKLVRDFQTHKHTFTCQKKNKVIHIKSNEGHGRNDGSIEGKKT